MTTANNKVNSDAIISEIEIASGAERVFEALVDPAQVVQWWGQAGIYICTEFHSDLRRGGSWRSAGRDGEGRQFEVKGEYLEIDPPRILEYTWTATWTGDAKTVVRWELEPKGEATLVRIRHSGFGAHPKLAQAYRGWPRMLGWLRALLERGETVKDRKPVSSRPA